MHIADCVGLLGVILIVIAYFLLQIEKIKSEQMSYSVLNGVGAAMILYSLFFIFCVEFICRSDGNHLVGAEYLWRGQSLAER